MSEIVLIVAVAAGLACPLHMWWMNRQGKRAACCPPRRQADPGTDAAALHERRAQIEARLAEFEDVDRDDAGAAVRTRG